MSTDSPALVRLHPHSIKYLQKGHPWVTKDSFTEKFPPKATWLEAKQGKHTWALAHDPQHPHVKARVWKVTEGDRPAAFNFENDLTTRLVQAFEKRKNYWTLNERDHFYLAFGEADLLPGLFVLKLNQVLLIQIKMEFWSQQSELLKTSILTAIKSMPSDFKWIIFESRHDSKRPQRTSWSGGELPASTDIHEFGVKYHLHWGAHYDHGIYTDMSEIRLKLKPNFKGARVLNLFAYSGAFSLYALQCGATEVVSVDLSAIYLEWLSENLDLNLQLDKNRHSSLCMSVEKALAKLASTKAQFDLVICDPPSFSSDGQKSAPAWEKYPAWINAITQVLDPGGKMALFLNTHQLNRGKFKNILIQSVHSRAPLKILSQWGLSGDTGILKGHPEGDYLKGFLLK